LNRLFSPPSGSRWTLPPPRETIRSGQGTIRRQNRVSATLRLPCTRPANSSPPSSQCQPFHRLFGSFGRTTRPFPSGQTLTGRRDPAPMGQISYDLGIAHTHKVTTVFLQDPQYLPCSCTCMDSQCSWQRFVIFSRNCWLIRSVFNYRMQQQKNYITVINGPPPRSFSVPNETQHSSALQVPVKSLFKRRDPFLRHSHQ